MSPKISHIPDKPGVYLLKDKSGKIIYIGKAISLKKRLPAHFREDSRISPHIADLDYFITSNELEALMLEATLIKKHRPRFNVLLRDDKQYPYIKLTMNEEWPRLIIARKIVNDGAKYFGPYRGQTVRDTFKLIKRLFRIRWCNNFKKRQQPCFYYHMGKCTAPCAREASREEYVKTCRDIEYFLLGKYDIAIDKLNNEMTEASKNKDYESAAEIRDRIRAFSRLNEEQKVISSDNKDRDVFALSRTGSYALAMFLEIRAGKLISKQSFFLKKAGNEDSELTQNILAQYYSSAVFVPVELVADIDTNTKKLISTMLSKIKGRKVRVNNKDAALCKMAKENSDILLERNIRQHTASYEALADLKNMLGMGRLPFRIEAFDISTTMGVETVGSMVVFEGGEPLKADYRKFRISPANTASDVAGIQETVKRRYQGSLARELPLPDLILIDGGRPQLNSALKASPKGIPVIGLAKKLEEIYIPKNRSPLSPDKNLPAMKLIRRIRDEAHRFAITFHKQRRAKAMLLG